MPESSIQVDEGTEFNQLFTQWCRAKVILSKRTTPYRHKQSAMMESLKLGSYLTVI
jgi:cell division protein YceG involved in septum cleavage